MPLDFMEPHRHANNLPHFPACDWCRGCVVGMCMALSGCESAPPQREPLSLAQAKSAISEYCDSGGYIRDIRTVADQAAEWLAKRVAQRSGTERLCAIFDIDETVLSNAPLIRRLDFAYSPSDWVRWHESADAPAVEPVCDLFRIARSLGIAVCFITGRREATDRAATELNLQRRGLGDYERLVLAPEPRLRGPMGQYKAGVRRALADEGFTIIANIGDQDSDLRGGYAERVFKLPDPFYLVE